MHKDTVAQRVLHRRTLYRSLIKRGLANEDSDTKTVSGTLLDSFGRVVRNPRRYSETQLAGMADQWFRKALEVYNDDEYPYAPPEGWRRFLVFLKQLSLHPERFSADNVAYELQKAMDTFIVELTTMD